MLDMSFHRHHRREILKVPHPERVVIAYDHMVPAPDRDSAEAHAYGREFARRFGIARLHDVGPDQGISHAIVADKAYTTTPGVVRCACPHARVEAFNCAARGIGIADLIAAITASRPCRPAVMRYDLHGALRQHVGEDLFHLAACRASTNQNLLEFGGPGMADLGMFRAAPSPRWAPNLAPSSPPDAA